MSTRKIVNIWTDGSCIRNPGPGGYAASLVYGDTHRELSGGYRLTTNNRMELMAAIAALQALKQPCSVAIHSDATYLITGVMNGTMRRWRRAGWYRGDEVAAPNADLWDQLLKLCDVHEGTFTWIKSHRGEPGNERCDQLAKRAASGPDLPPDAGYESPSFPPPRPTLFDALPD